MPKEQISTEMVSSPEDLDKGFVQVQRVLFERGKHLTLNAKLLFVALRSFKNEKRGTFPSYKKIMDRSGLSRNAVARGLKELERFGWISRRVDGGGRSNHYEFFYPTLIDVVTKQEVGPQLSPTKEQAQEWKAEHSRENKNKGFIGSIESQNPNDSSREELLN